MKVVAADPEEDQRFQMQHPTSFLVVRNVFTEIPLKRVKKTTVLPFGQWAQTGRLS